MPIFEYSCESCGAEFERLVFPSEKDPVTCPQCKQESVKKKMSAASLCNRKSDGCGSAAPRGFS